MKAEEARLITMVASKSLNDDEEMNKLFVEKQIVAQIHSEAGEGKSSTTFGLRNCGVSLNKKLIDRIISDLVHEGFEVRSVTQRTPNGTSKLFITWG